MEFGLFLKIAARAAAALAELHGHGVLHLNICPQNIYTESGGDKVQFSAAGGEKSNAAGTALRGSSQLSFPYMSPEQTGRMNRSPDHRSDLYSLGISFYQVLTGRLPFVAADPLEWVHCHLARTPLPPLALVPEVPQTVSDIIMKLLAKMPEDRYQSASGLQFDLEECSRQWEMNRSIPALVLATHDVSECLQISRKLYGRQAELERLSRAFDRVASSARPELVVVTGYSGIGKSSLVHQLHKSVVRERGYFLCGKFEQYKHDIPYRTIAQTFHELILQLLGETEEQLARRKLQFQQALGVNSGLLVEIIPELELILGAKPLAAQGPPAEAQLRLLHAFANFFQVLAQGRNPVVLFLDDLQWVDAESLKLIEYLITNPDTRYLLLVGAYRDNDLGSDHPLRESLATIQRAGAEVEQIALRPLAEEHLDELLTDTLHCPRAEVLPLGRLLQNKTQGNPFFVNQFLTTVHQQGLLRFDKERGAWTWNTDQIEAENLSDNVAELMVDKLKSLPPATQQALQLAACLGNAFELRILAVVSQRAEQEIQSQLQPAVREGLLHSNRAYHFMHDRVYEAAYVLIPAMQRAEVHLRIGRLLLAHTSEGTLDESVFEIVNHLNRAALLLDSDQEKIQLAQLNLSAARKAMAATAYASALLHLSAAQTLLPRDAWDSLYPITYGLHLMGAQCEWLCGNSELAQELVQVLMDHARTRLDQVSAYRVKIGLHTTRGEVGEAAEAALRACTRLYGLDLCLHPSWDALRQRALRVREELGERSIEELLELPVMSDPDTEAAIALLSTSLPSAYFTDSNFHDAMSCEIVRLSLAHGNCEFSPHGYVTFGALLGRLFENWEEAYRFGKLALGLVEKHGLTTSQASAYYTTASFINFWVEPVHKVIPLFRQALSASHAHGDMNHACYSANQIVMCRLIAGDQLAEVAREAEEHLTFTARARYEAMHDAIRSMKQFVENLQGATLSFGSYDTREFHENQFEASLADKIQPTRNLIYYTYKALALLLAGNYRQAAEAADAATRFMTAFTGQVPAAEYCFVTALTRAAHYDQVAPEKQSEYLESLRQHQRQLDAWQKHCPETFFNRYALVSAELARISGRILEAEQLYEQAIGSARENGFIQNQALASELAARFYRARGLSTIAGAYLRQSRACYLRWGARGKIKQLDGEYPELASESLAHPPAMATPGAEQLDALALMKASQAISGQIVLEHLLDILMHTVLEIAGADKALLVLTRDEKASFAAEARVEGRAIEVRVHPQQELAGCALPWAALNYVRRSREKVILADASAQNPFAEDGYFSTRPPKSLLCLPILKQTDLIGLLYLENSLIPDAFTPSRLAGLEVVATQAAISLENAALYTDLEKEIKNRARVEEDLDRFFNMSSDLLCFADFNGYLKRVNPAFERILGFSADELLATPLIEFVHSEDRAATRAEYEKLLRGSPSMFFENRCRSKDGSYRWIEWSATPLVQKELIYGLGRDVTERRLAEEALRSSEDKFSKAFHASPASMGIASLKTGRMMDVNESFLKLFGFQLEEVIGHTAAELGIWENPAEREEIIARLEVAPVRNREVRFRAKGGRAFDALFSGEIVSFGDEECLLAVALDVTEQRRLEDQLRQAQRMEAIGTLSGGIAHDFNNLLTVIKGYSSLILTSTQDPELRCQMERIDEAADRAAALTSQLLAFSRRQVLQPKVFDLNTLVLNLDKMLRRLIGEDIEMVTVTSADRTPVKADPGQIEQVIMNLVVNARDAMAQGGKLTLETANVELDPTFAREHPGISPGRYVLLGVSDTGIGMDSNIQTHIFEPFFTTKKPGKGTGLGLSTVYGIVKQSGGSIWVQSEPGQGTTFKVYLPWVDAPAEVTTREQRTIPDVEGNETILLVEDDPQVRDLARSVLAALGYSVLVAGSASAASSESEAYAGIIDLLLTDVVMPGHSGPQLARQIALRRPLIKVLYMSGYTTTHAMIQQGELLHQDELDPGAFLLSKPFTPDLLALKVREVLDRG